MRSRLVLHMACILLIVSISSADISWPFYEDSIVSNPEFSLDQTDQLSSPVDHKTSSFVDINQLPDESIFEDQDDTSSALNQDGGWSGISTWTDVALDGSPELLACSSSEFLPAAGKSRMKRLNEAGVCKDGPAASSSDGASSVSDGIPDLSGLREVLPQSPDDVKKLLGAMGDEDQNTFCVLYTKFVLPYGVCSVGEVMVAGVLTIPAQRTFYQYKLKQFTIGMLGRKSTNPYCLPLRIFPGC